MVQADSGAGASSEKVNEPEEWLPIETAPRDGTDILAFAPGFGMGHMVLYWMDDYWREKANCMGLKYPPSHWMPLPPPPSSGERTLQAQSHADCLNHKPESSPPQAEGQKR